MIEKLEQLMLKAAETLQHEKVKWHIAYMGEINVLGTLYLIAKPIAGEQISSARVFIARNGDVSKCEEVLVTKASTYRGSGLVVDTSYGCLHFSSDHKEVKFCYGSGEVFSLKEFTFLN